MALSSSLVTLGIFVGIYALLALSLNLKFGYNGLLDIGHVAFYLIGAYTTALLVAPPSSSQQFITYILGLELPWVVAVPIAMLVAGVFGMLVALPAIRLREDYLAITLLGVSVIVQRVVQVEGWIANGPGTLRGYGTPLQSHFALPGTTPADAVVLAAIVAVVWAIMSYLLAYVVPRETSRTVGQRVVDGALTVTTLGVGYLAARHAKRSSRPDPRYPVLAGLVVGVAAGAAAYTGWGTTSVFVFFGLPSLFTWLFGGVAVANYYGDLESRDVATAFALAIGFVGTFVPLIILGGGSGDVQSSIGLVATILLLSGFLFGLFRLGHRWNRSGRQTSFIRIIGVGALVLFVLRYFVLSLVTPYKTGGLTGAFSNLLQNTLWMMKFTSTPTGFSGFLSQIVVEFGYPRFLLVLVFAVLGIVFLVLETTVKSPFGRVLRAIREDEQVATSLGKNTFSYKIQSMVLGSAIAGLAGALWAVYATSLVFTMFAPRVTFFAFLMVIIGGTANNHGVVLGSVIYWVFEQATADIASYFPTAARSSVQALRLAFIGALLIAILYYRPEGLWGEERMVSGGEVGE